MVYVYKAKDSSAIPFKKILIRSFLVTLIALGLGWITKKFFLFSHKLQTSSMFPTFKKDEIIYLTRVWSKLEYGNVVLAYVHNPKKVFIARVIGVEGDKISIKNKKVYKNGKQIELPFHLSDKRASFGAQVSTRDNLETIRVGKNQYFLLCENQDECLDSRDVGLISKSNIIGKKIF